MTCPRAFALTALAALGLAIGTASAQPPTGKPAPGQPTGQPVPGQPTRPMPPTGKPVPERPTRPMPPTGRPVPERPIRPDRFERLATGWVETYLGRKPTARELTTLTTQLRSGLDPARVQANVLSSNDYFVRAGRNLTNFARALVRDVAARPATPLEIQNLTRLAAAQGRNAAALQVIVATQVRPPVVVPVPIIPVVPIWPIYWW